MSVYYHTVISNEVSVKLSKSVSNKITNMYMQVKSNSFTHIRVPSSTHFLFSGFRIVARAPNNMLIRIIVMLLAGTCLYFLDILSA
jgi:hypothetical protein